MPLLAAWSLAVYCGTAALTLWLVHRWVLPLRLPVALLIAAAPLFFTGRATLIGGVYAPVDILSGERPFVSHREANAPPARTPLLSDVVFSMIPWQQAVRGALTSGELPLWNPYVLAGEPLAAVQQPAALHPGTWIGLLLPLPQGWTFQMSLRLLIAVLSAFLYFRQIGCRDAAALLGAAAWAFSDFMVFYVGYPVSSALGPFPLLLLGLDRLVRDSDRRAVGLTSAALFLIAVAGHPETLLYAVATAGIYFLCRLAAAGRGHRWRPVLLSLAAGAIALGLTAIPLALLAEALPQTWEYTMRSEWYAHVQKSVTLIESARRAVPILLPFAYGQSGQGMTWKDFGVPAAYAGAILFPLALTGLFSRNPLRYVFLGLGLLGAALWMRLWPVIDVVGVLPLFRIGVLEYMIFAALFALAALAALGAERLRAGEGSRGFVAGSVATAAAIGCLFGWRHAGMTNLGMSPEFLRGRLLGEIVPLALGLVVLAVARRRQAAGGLAAALLVLVVATRVAEAGGMYPTLPSSAFYPDLPLLNAIPRGVPERFVATGYAFSPNTATMYGLEDVRGYESMTFQPIAQTFFLWCEPTWTHRVDDLGRPFLSFLNVRYALVEADTPAPPGWKTLSRDPGGDVLENSAALARAFVPGWIHYEPDGMRRLEALKGITDFGERGVLGTAPPPGSPDWVRNGPARVTVASYRSNSMTLAVDAEQEAVIATSVTAWRGWQARLDGAPLEPLGYNHAFLGFRVPAGRHRIDLRYRPRGFGIGATLSVLTLVAIAVFSRRRPEPRT